MTEQLPPTPEKNGGSGPRIDFFNSTFANRTAFIGVATSFTLPVAQNITGTATYTLSGRPSWLNFNSNTRTASGTPNESGFASYLLTYQAIDSAGGSGSASFSLSVFDSSFTDLMPTAPNISNKTATVGSTFSTTLAAGSGGDTPLSYTASPLPAGLSFNSSTRVISGTPTTAGTTTVTYTVTDDDGDSDTDTFTITVSAAPVTTTAPGVPTSVSLDDSRPRLSKTYMVSRQRRRGHILPGRNPSRDKRKLYKQRNANKPLHPQRTVRKHPIPRPSSCHKLCRLVRLLVTGQHDDRRRKCRRDPRSSNQSLLPKCHGHRFYFYLECSQYRRNTHPLQRALTCSTRRAVDPDRSRKCNPIRFYQPLTGYHLPRMGTSPQ